jgi:hypothetical protein
MDEALECKEQKANHTRILNQNDLVPWLERHERLDEPFVMMPWPAC